MIRIVFYILVLSAVTVGGVAPLVAQEAPSETAKSRTETAAEAPSAEAIARRMQHFYRKTEDFKADFTQTYTDLAAGEEKRSRGKVYFKKPGRMRWDYYAADGEKTKSGLPQREKVLVSDGKTFWIYEYKFRQVFKECLSDSQLPTSLRFLMGEGDLFEDFTVSYAKKSTRKRPILRLEPRQPTARYAALEFVVDPESFQVIQTTVFDPYGNTNRINFDAAQVNQNLPDSGFKFKTPPGARLLNPRKSCE